MRNSIFELDEKLGYKSPFSRWTLPNKTDTIIKSSTQLLFSKILGPNIVSEGAIYEFIIKGFNIPTKELNLNGVIDQIKWGYEIDSTGIKTINQKAIYLFSNNEIVLKWKIPKLQNGQYLKVYAWTDYEKEAVVSTSSILNYPFDFRSYRVAGKSADYALKTAEDMCYGDGISKTDHSAYDIEQIKTIGHDIDKFFNSEPNELFYLFEEMATSYFSTGELEVVIKDMIKKLSNSKGDKGIEIYTNEVLTKCVKEHEQTKRFLKNIEEKLKIELQKHQCNPICLFNSNIQFKNTDDELQRPIFGNLVRNKDRFNASSILTGLTIIIHDIWSYRVKIKKFDTNDSKNYSITCGIELLDHFGLDIKDMRPKIIDLGKGLPELKINFADFDGFKAWFVLQHLKSYKPFITKIEFDQTFYGTI